MPYPSSPSSCLSQSYRNHCVPGVLVQSLSYHRTRCHPTDCQPDCPEPRHPLERIQDAGPCRLRKAQNTFPVRARAHRYVELWYRRCERTLRRRVVPSQCCRRNTHVVPRELANTVASICLRVVTALRERCRRVSQAPPRRSGSQTCWTCSWSACSLLAVEVVRRFIRRL